MPKIVKVATYLLFSEQIIGVSNQLVCGIRCVSIVSAAPKGQNSYV